MRRWPLHHSPKPTRIEQMSSLGQSRELIEAENSSELWREDEGKAKRAQDEVADGRVTHGAPPPEDTVASSLSFPSTIRPTKIWPSSSSSMTA